MFDSDLTFISNFSSRFFGFCAWIGISCNVFFDVIYDLLVYLFVSPKDSVLFSSEIDEHGLAYLYPRLHTFLHRRVYRRAWNCFDNALSSFPGAWIDILKRKKPELYSRGSFKIEEPRSFTRALNLGSYNYLGFAGPGSPFLEKVLHDLEHYSVSTCSFRSDIGSTKLHIELEKLVAEYVKKPDCIIYGQGFATNSTTIPSLVGKGGCIISDSINHASMVSGSRASGAYVIKFEHNNMNDLERKIRRAILYGHPITKQLFSKILIMVEGIYSMEGEILKLDEVVYLKKKYKCYLYLDEAHSIGCLGKSGGGVTEYRNVDPDDVDILMGTFTKSFAGVGGYVASSKEIINYLRLTCSSYLYSPTISPPTCQQIISTINVIMGRDGTNIGKGKIEKVRQNANFFRQGLIDIGCKVLGDWDSPIIPILIYSPTTLAFFFQACLERQLATVLVSAPAVPLMETRARFCISASHTTEDLQEALNKLAEVAQLVHIRFNKSFLG